MSNNCPEEQPHWPRSFGPKDGLIKKKKKVVGPEVVKP